MVVHQNCVTMESIYRPKVLAYATIATLAIFLAVDRLTVGPPLIKRVLISQFVSNHLKPNYGLINYSLKTHCKGSIKCFVKFIPEPTKSKYDRIGDLLYGMESGHPGNWRQLQGFLLNKEMKNKFAGRYLRSMGWLEQTTSDNEKIKTDQVHFRHNWIQAKQDLLTYANRYKSAGNNEIVIYVRAGDKLNATENKTCVRARNQGGCSKILENYADYIGEKATEITEKNHDITKITIVTARRLSKPTQAETKLFTDIIRKISPITDNIWIHSSNDLDEDLFYMGTAKYLVAHRDIGNLSYLVREIQAAKITN